MNNLFRTSFLVSFLLIATSMTQPPKTRIVFFGDSITQMGVERGGYIAQMVSQLKVNGQHDQYELIGAGISGNKVYDLYLRLEEDVLKQKPQVVVIWIGVNDVWHKTSGTGTDPDKFERFYEAIIKKLQANRIQVVLATPAVIGERTDHSNSQDGDLNHYSQIIRKLSKRYGTGLADLRKAFLAFNLKNNTENSEQGILTTDRVHLNHKGNALVAEHLWSVLTQMKQE